MWLDLAFRAGLGSKWLPMRSSLAAFLLPPIVLAITSCGPGSNNPFANLTPAATPPPDADIEFTANTWSTDPTQGREVFAIKIDGTEQTRLSFCNNNQTCDVAVAALSPERQRAALVTAVGGAASYALDYLDLTNGGTVEFVPATTPVTSIDWSGEADQLLYSSEAGPGQADHLMISSVARPPDNNPNDITCSSGTSIAEPTVTACDSTLNERHPRYDTLGQDAIFERTVSGGTSDIYVFAAFSTKSLISPGTPGGQALPGTVYRIGDDADPAVSPDELSVVFRTLTGLGDGIHGTWSLVTTPTSGTPLTTIVSGVAYRGAPDWGPKGIVFPELDLATNRFSLVVVQPDGSGRQVVFTAPPGFVVSSPRWLR